MGQDRRGDTSRCGGRRGTGSAGLFRPFFVVVLGDWVARGDRVVRSGQRGDEITGLFDVFLLDEDLELRHPVDGEGIDERSRPAADDGDDAVAPEEVLDQVRFERALDASDFDEVFVFGHGGVPFPDRR